MLNEKLIIDFVKSLNFESSYQCPSAWIGHEKLAHFLIKTYKPKTIVELGVHNGFSYFSFCQTVHDYKLETKCFGIDSWQGDQHAGFYDEKVYKEVLKQNKKYQYFSELIKKNFNSALADFKDHSIDFLHIDGYHTYDAVKSDFTNWLPKCTKDGLILFHDVNEFRNDFGVYKLFNELKQSYSHFMSLHAHGLGIITLSNNKDNIINFLNNFDIQTNFSALLQDQHRELLKKNKLEQSINTLNQTLTNKDKELEQTKHALTNKDKELEQTKHALTNKDKELGQTEHELATMLLTTSWKITKPLRYLKNTYKKTCSYALFICNRKNWKNFFFLIIYIKNHFGLINGLFVLIKKFNELDRQDFLYRIKKILLRVQNNDRGEQDILSVRLNFLLDEIKSRFSYKYDSVDLPDKISHPKISILLPIYKVDISLLQQAIESVLWQSYKNWELCIVDDCSDCKDISNFLTQLSKSDSRIKVLLLKTNLGISGATNKALSMASGDFIALLDNDDLLTNDALISIAYEIENNYQADVFYSDECKIDKDGNPKEIFTKPDWSPVLMFNCMFIGHLVVYRTKIVRKVGGFRSEFDYSQDYDLALRVTEQTREIVHVEKVLYGWRMIESSASVGGKPFARSSNVKALQEAVDRRGLMAKVIALPSANRVLRDHSLFKSLVSIVIPSDNLKNILDTIGSIEKKTSYKNYEIVIVTNSKIINQINIHDYRSILKLIAYNKPYNFSDKCNEGFAHSDGHFVVFFNDDVRVVTSDWIECILEYLTLDGVGIVGPKLIYENGGLQHAGMVTGIRRLVGTAFHALPENTHAHYNFAQSVREVSLICGACLGIKRKIFEDIGGFDALHTPINHSDVDLCLKIKAKGFSCIYTPYAKLTHIGHFSSSLADVDKKKFFKPLVKEKADIWLLKRWAKDLARDPYFTKSMRQLIYHDSPENYEIFPASSNSLEYKKDALLVSHDLSESGAPRLIYEIALSLLSNGYFVVVVSPTDGPIRNLLNNIGVIVIVDELILRQHQTVLDFARNFDVVIANTTVSWPILKDLPSYVDVFLYVHELELVNEIAKNNKNFKSCLLQAKFVIVATEHQREILLNYIPKDKIKILTYGIEDIQIANKKILRQQPYKPKGSKSFKVALFGSFEKRKGQDLLLASIELLPKNIRAKCDFYFYGRIIDAKFFTAFSRNAKNFGDVKIEINIPFNQYIDKIFSSDFVIVPSREDTLPLVSLHALAASRILVCSSNIGTCDNIEDGKSGFIIEKNTPLSLAITLEKAIDSKNLKEISINARNVFEKNFSRKNFSENLIKLIKD